MENDVQKTALEVIKEKYQEDVERITAEKDKEIEALKEQLKQQEEKHVKELQALFLGRNENLNNDDLSIEDKLTKSLSQKFNV